MKSLVFRMLTGLLILAAVGGAVGMWAFMWCSRHCEATGYARPTASRPRHEDEEVAG